MDKYIITGNKGFVGLNLTNYLTQIKKPVLGVSRNPTEKEIDYTGLNNAVLNQAKDELLDWHGAGLSIMEMSHRSPEVVGVAEAAEQTLRDLRSHHDLAKKVGEKLGRGEVLQRRVPAPPIGGTGPPGPGSRHLGGFG